ncbi:MAG TPA: NAD-dependent epimerase/dehydratase family protein [Thermoleophilia bacterium]|nr:NAD-dependent epimerase/dehydratase family protein [Thermoleophilia bacterium]
MDEMSVSRGPNDPTRAESTRGDAGPAQPAAGVSITGLQVVLGASGGTGGAVVRELARRGSSVRAVSRSGRTPGADSVQGVASDVMDASALRAAVAGASVVYHCVNVPYQKWVTELRPLTERIIDAAATAGARLVFTDNLYCYGPLDGPITEDAPLAATTRKGQLRAAVRTDLLTAHRDRRARVVVTGASDYYGPFGPNSFAGERFMKQLLAGKKVQWLADLEQPHSANYLDDMARAIVILGNSEAAEGQVWHLPAAQPLTGRQFVELAARAAGVEPRSAAVGRTTMRFLGLFSPLLREIPELWYEWERPFVIDASKFQRAYGPFAVTPHQEALQQTVAWFRGASS